MKKKLLLVGLATLTLLLFACANNTTATAKESGGKDLLITKKTTQYFTDEAIPESDIEAMLNAGVNTASAMNKQDWYFTAITNKDLLKELKTKSEENMPPQMKGQPNPKAGIGDSPLTIVVSHQINEKFSEVDAALATQKICDYAMLSGYGVKIVAAPCSMINANYKEKLGIPSNMEAVTVILVGKAKDMSNVDGVTSASTRKSFDEVAKIIK